MKNENLLTIETNYDKPLYISSYKSYKNQFTMNYRHYHPAYEIFYVSTGGTTFIIDDMSYPLYQGDFLILPPGKIHRSIYSTYDVTSRVELYVLPEILPGVCLNILNQYSIDFHRTFPLKHQSKMVNLLNLVEEEINGNSPYNMDLCIAYLTEIVIHISRHSKKIISQKSGDEAEIQQILNYIEENYAKDLNISTLSAHFNISPSSLFKKFNQKTNIKLTDYINYTRTTKAMQFLSETDLSITEIAYKCGFNDSNYFSTVFKKYIGVSPNQFRKK